MQQIQGKKKKQNKQNTQTPKTKQTKPTTTTPTTKQLEWNSANNPLQKSQVKGISEIEA